MKEKFFSHIARFDAKATALTAALMLLGSAAAPVAEATSDDFQFELVPSGAVLQCLPDAKGTVRIESDGGAEMMTIKVTGLPPQTEFDVFVIQVPNFPFGLSWYQGDIQTNARGKGKARFVGRFNEETFIVAPGVAPAPIAHEGAFPDADLNPQTAPVHTYHLGLWFNSAEDARKAGCLDIVTPFNGEHQAGIQVLNTSHFPDGEGPLSQVKS